jgi:cell division protein FtsB
MSELHLLEDDATLYVLDQLTETERDEFEVRLAESAELRALVRELEEGAVAAAMAAPRRRVPKQVWEQIEKTITRETRPPVLDITLWFGWLRNGWAVAAACLVGWLLYAHWPDRAGSTGVAPAPLASEFNVQPDGTLMESARTETVRVTPPTRNAADVERRSLQRDLLATRRENGALRMRNTELAKQVTHLSQALTQQQALLAESSRLKFFQLAPPADVDTGVTNAIPSPELQRALFLAMARELGWLQLPATTQPGLTQTNLGGVDFVDLQPGTNTMSAPINLQSLMETEPASTPESPMLASDSGNAIPGFVSSTNVVLAFEPSTSTPTGSALNFWTHDSSQSFQLLGSTVLEGNPLVVTFSAGVPNSVGMNFTITPGSAVGTFNVIGQSPLTSPTNSTPP